MISNFIFNLQAIGKFIASSGIPKIMIESGIIAEGSMKGFLSGTHFNRCKTIHVATATALKILHFNAFLEKYQDDAFVNKDKLLVNEIADMLEDENRSYMDIEVLKKKLEDVLNEYNSYTEKTLKGLNGHTAKFALMYVSLVELFQTFEYAIRTCDIELYIYAAFKICPIFFIFNHQNYSRWLTWNIDELMNIQTTHPGLIDEFSNGGLSIRRTKKNFSRSAIDITLEQTINANAANKLTGIAAFTNNLSARQRWSETHTIRTAIITELMNSLGLNSTNENEGEYKTKIFKSRLTKFSEEICQNINPFNDELNREKLFNLSTGKAASQQTADFLLNVETNGVKKMESFIRECQIDENRFGRPIKKSTINNFSSELFKNKHSSIKNITETKAERNILGQILCLALRKEIDLASVLSYPLTAVPHSIAHFDGSMVSNYQKAELTNLFISKLNSSHVTHSNDQPKFDVDIIDGFHLLNNLREPPVKYGQFANLVLQNICRTNAHEVHLIFHKDQSPSPGDVNARKQRELYGDSTMNFKIKGPNQERSSSLIKCLKSSSFRNELVQFFVDHWSKEEEMCAKTLNEKRVFLSFGNNCYLFSNQFPKGRALATFENNHFEIELKIILHLSKITALNIRVKIENPDAILVYLLYHLKNWPNEKQLWIEYGDISRNTLRVINVRQIYGVLTPNLIDALPAWFVFSGCLYEPSFYGKARKTCLKVLEKSTGFQRAFGQINADMREEDVQLIEQFTCQLYGSKENSVNTSRLDIFLKGYSSTNFTDFKKNGESMVFYDF